MDNSQIRVYVKKIPKKQNLVLIERGKESYPFASCANDGLYFAGPTSDSLKMKRAMKGIASVEVGDEERSNLVKAIIEERNKIGKRGTSWPLSKYLVRLVGLIQS